MTYYWLKAGHIIFMVFWMSGLFMLPRQMIYLHAAAPGSEESALWAKRMGLLRKVILTPSLIVVWVLGLLLAMVSRQIVLCGASDGVPRRNGRTIQEDGSGRAPDDGKAIADLG